MEECSLPKARPISCSVCPAFQRRHTSSFCSAENPNLPPCFINTTFEKALYQMVLHRPFEPAASIRQFEKPFKGERLISHRRLCSYPMGIGQKRDHSYRNASMGSSREAFRAG